MFCKLNTRSSFTAELVYCAYWFKLLLSSAWASLMQFSSIQRIAASVQLKCWSSPCAIHDGSMHSSSTATLPSFFFFCWHAHTKFYCSNIGSKTWPWISYSILGIYGSYIVFLVYKLLGVQYRVLFHNCIGWCRCCSIFRYAVVLPLLAMSTSRSICRRLPYAALALLDLVLFSYPYSIGSKFTSKTISIERVDTARFFVNLRVPRITRNECLRCRKQ